MMILLLVHEYSVQIEVELIVNLETWCKQVMLLGPLSYPNHYTKFGHCFYNFPNS